MGSPPEYRLIGGGRQTLQRRPQVRVQPHIDLPGQDKIKIAVSGLRRVTVARSQRRALNCEAKDSPGRVPIHWTFTRRLVVHDHQPLCLTDAAVNMANKAVQHGASARSGHICECLHLRKGRLPASDQPVVSGRQKAIQPSLCTGPFRPPGVEGQPGRKRARSQSRGHGRRR